MKTIAIDTNVLLTLALQRPYKQKEIQALFKKCKEQRLFIFVPTPAILEFEWVMRSFYKQERLLIAEFFEEMFLMENIKNDAKEILRFAVNIYKTNKSVSFTDCLIVSQIHDSSFDFFTLDDNLEKLHKGLS
ncbi:MAG: PIN domain-containing protein [Patescibacteria group bacterium]